MKLFVARDKNGGLSFFRNKPVKCAHNNEKKNTSFWADIKDEDYYLDLDILFFDVQWENEPLEIELYKQDENLNQDSRQAKRFELIRLVRNKMEQYEAQLAKQNDNISCDDVDWVELSSDMFSLLQTIQKSL